LPGVYNQLGSYLTMARAYSGHSNVFGIVSNYNKWDVCWLGGTSDELVGANNIDDVQHSMVQSQATAQGSLPYTRQLCHKGPIAWDDPELPKTLAGVLIRAYYSSMMSRASSPPITVDRFYKTVHVSGPDGWITKMPADIEKREGGGIRSVSQKSHRGNPRQLPQSSAQGFILLESLGAGLHGVVWRCCSKTACAVLSSSSPPIRRAIQTKRSGAGRPWDFHSCDPTSTQSSSVPCLSCHLSLPSAMKTGETLMCAKGCGTC